MANQEHLDILMQGVEVWNQWRKEHPDEKLDFQNADLSEADLRDADLKGADFFKANLEGADLRGAKLYRADFIGATLRDANLSGADLIGADLSVIELNGVDLSSADLSSAYLINTDLMEANLSEATLYRTDLNGATLYRANLTRANLTEANLSEADLSEADLSEANLTRAILVETKLTGATLNQCSIYGIAAWKVELEGTTQKELVITPKDEPMITVDNLKIAQFIYLLLNNQEIRDVIDTITSKVVLILGRFTPQRKRVLDALRNELRKKDYLPIVFDFQKPANRDLTETVSTLAHMARFIIADITDPKSIPQELKTIVPNLPSVVVQPLLHAKSKEYGMFEHFKSFPWVLEAYRYTTVDRLLASLKEHVVEPAEQKSEELQKH